MCSVLDNPKALKNWNFDKNITSPKGREVAGGGKGREGFNNSDLKGPTKWTFVPRLSML